MAEQLTPRAPNELPWSSKLGTSVSGFRQAAGLVEIILGYVVVGEVVGLVAVLSLPGAPPQVWRQFWTPKAEAMNAAADLCADCMEYLAKFHLPIRPVEDLDYDDFLEHLHCRINGDLH
jgi:hypothetical protein